MTAPVRLSDPAPSHYAADRARKGTLTERVALVLHDHASGLTDHEILAKLGEPPHRLGSVIRRRADVGAVPALERRGEPLRRLTPSGRVATVWRLPDEDGAA